jgi:hypothetical protein
MGVPHSGPRADVIQRSNDTAYRVRFDGVADEVPLRFAAAQVGERPQLAFGFDALGNRIKAERLAHGDDRAHE